MEELERRVARIRTSISKGRNDLVSGNRTRIIETATRLFRAEGYQRTAIGDIAALDGKNRYEHVDFCRKSAAQAAHAVGVHQ